MNKENYGMLPSYLLIAVSVILIAVFAIMGNERLLMASVVFLMYMIGISIGQHIKIHQSNPKNQ